MQPNLKTIACAAAVSLGLAAPAAAVTVTQLGGNGDGGAAAIETTETNGMLTVKFEWTSAPMTFSFIFEADAAFDLNLVTYTATGTTSTSDVTGVMLDSPTRLTNTTSFCSGAALGLGGNCDLITGLTQTGGNTGIATRPGEAVLSNLAAGQYELGLYDSASPTSGVVEFSFTDPASATVVPLPAGLPLLAGGLGAVALVRRRKSA